MKKIFIIILDPIADFSDTIKTIECVGDYYSVYGNNQYLVSTTCQNAKELYDKITNGNNETPGIVVVEVDSANDLSYWGYADKDLWAWFDEHKSPKEDK